MSMFTKPQKRTSRLAEALAVSSAKEHLFDLPDYLAKLIEDFEARDVHPEYRQDVYKTLAAAVNVCRTVINPSYPAKPAIEEIGQLMTMLPRMLLHLTNRPTTTGWAIMIPHTREIFPSVYSTEGEAQAQLAQLQAFSPAIRGNIIPVRITSEHVSAPEAPKRLVEPLLRPDRPAALASDDPIPQGIRPPRQLSFDDLMQRVARVEGEVSEGLSPPVSGAPEGPPAATNAGRMNVPAEGKSPPTATPGTGNNIP